MNLTGRAVVADGQDFTVQENTVPDPVPHGIVLKQELGGICGTDLHKWQQFLPGPTLLGHESVGTVVALGQEMQKDFQGQPLKEGDRVVYHPRNSGTAYGYRGLEFPFSGGFADYISLSDPETCVLKTETDARTAVLAEPFAIGTHAVMRAEVQLGDSVIVQAPGQLALWCLSAPALAEHPRSLSSAVPLAVWNLLNVWVHMSLWTLRSFRTPNLVKSQYWLIPAREGARTWSLNAPAFCRRFRKVWNM